MALNWFYVGKSLCHKKLHLFYPNILWQSVAIPQFYDKTGANPQFYDRQLLPHFIIKMNIQWFYEYKVEIINQKVLNNILDSQICHIFYIISDFM